MKKTVLLLLACILLLCGCSRTEERIPVHFSILRSDTEIALDAPAAPILEILGAPFGYSENESSRAPGVEKSYRFAGLNLKTYPSEDGDRILCFLLTDESLATAEGIRIGASAEEVRQCYGENAISNNRCTLSHHAETLTLLLKNNVVTAIQYSLL